MQGFYPGEFPVNSKILHTAQDDAEWCVAHKTLYDLKTYKDVCVYGLAMAKQKTYLVFYTDNPKVFYEAYVDRFARIIAFNLEIEVPDDPRTIWQYQEDKDRVREE